MLQESCLQAPGLAGGGGCSDASLPTCSLAVLPALAPRRNRACANQTPDMGHQAPFLSSCSPFRFCVWPGPVLPAHLSQWHVQEAPTAQGKQALRYGEGSEAIEGRPGAHILFVALS